MFYKRCETSLAAGKVEKRLCCLGDTVPSKKIKEAVIYNFVRVLYNISSLAQGCLQDCRQKVHNWAKRCSDIPFLNQQPTPTPPPPFKDDRNLNSQSSLFVCTFEKFVQRFQILLASLKKKSGPPFENLSSLGRGVADKNWKVHSSHVNDGVSPGRYMSTEIDHLKASW